MAKVICRAAIGGFTLIEFLAVLAVMGLLHVAALPGMSSWLEGVRVRSAGDEFFAALQRTRSEAIMRNARVVLCKSDGPAHCVQAGGWEQGWLIFQDDNNNAQADPGETILEHRQAMAGSVRLSGNSQVDAYVSYTPTGSASSVSGAFQAGTFTVCRAGTQGAEARQVILSSNGRVRSRRVSSVQCR